MSRARTSAHTPAPTPSSATESGSDGRRRASEPAIWASATVTETATARALDETSLSVSIQTAHSSTTNVSTARKTTSRPRSTCSSCSRRRVPGIASSDASPHPPVVARILTCVSSKLPARSAKIAKRAVSDSALTVPTSSRRLSSNCSMPARPVLRALPLRVLRREEHRRHLLVGRVAAADEHVDERREDGREGDGEEDGEAAEDDRDRRDGEQHDERREPRRVAEHLREHDVVLEQPDGEHDQAGRERRVPRFREADADRERAGGERPDHRHDLDDPGERADEDPVRQADDREGDREHGADEDDQQCLATDERAELRVDQVPRIPQTF